MKNLMIITMLAAPFLLAGQSNDYTMYMTVYLEPNSTQMDKLMEGMASYNKKHHNEGYSSAVVWSVSSGPNAGKWVWMMGPMKYTNLDNKPSDEQLDDWNKKVEPYLKGTGTLEYWKRNDELSVIEGPPRPLNLITFWKIKKGEGYRINGLMKGVKAAVEAMEGENPWGVYFNEFRQGEMGRHLGTVLGFKNWAEIDEDDRFPAAYKKVHGDDSWEPFIQSVNDIFEDSYDELWSLIPELNGVSNDQ